MGRVVVDKIAVGRRECFVYVLLLFSALCKVLSGPNAFCHIHVFQIGVQRKQISISGIELSGGGSQQVVRTVLVHI